MGGPAASSARDAAQVAEALRLNARYLDEVVVGWGLCPWAERALADGQVRRHVLLEAAPPADVVLRVIDDLTAAPEIAIGLVLLPRLELAAPAFDSFAERVRRADRARRAAGESAPFLVAAFHPAPAVAPDEIDAPARLVGFLRRTPDPTLQLVRASLLEGLGPSVSDDVARRNFAVAARRGLGALDALLREIRADRDASYARLAR